MSYRPAPKPFFYFHKINFLPSIMARPRKPTNVLDLSGAYKKNPQRRRPNEPKPEWGIGKAPRSLTPRQQAIWREIVKHCAPEVLTCQGRFTLEIICMGVDTVRQGTASPADSDRVFKQLGKFGLTPGERSNVLVDRSKSTRSGFGSL
jgi:hypothetical protein